MAETEPGPRARRRGPPVDGAEPKAPKAPGVKYETAGKSLGLEVVALAVLLWLAVLSYGMWENSQDTLAIPRKVKHRFILFDQIFRMAGPMFPFVIVIPRSVLPDLIVTPRGTVVQRGSVLGGPLLTLSFYLGLTLLRVTIYIVTYAFAPGSMADHVFLGASVYAMLTGEVLSCVKQMLDMRLKLKVEDPEYENSVKPKAVRLAPYVHAVQTGRVVLMLLAGGVAGLLLADMYYTARYFHTVRETAISLGAGLLLFQLPLAEYVLQRREWLPEERH